VAADRCGDLELGPDPVCRGDQQRILEAGRLGVEKGPEAAETGQGSGPLGALRQRLDRFDQGRAGFDVDAGGLVALAGYGFVLRLGVLQPRSSRDRRPSQIRKAL